jgi:hypothetical protein
MASLERDYWFARYRAVAKALCRAKGIDPDAVIDDAGHLAWELAAYETIDAETLPFTARLIDAQVKQGH